MSQAQSTAPSTASLLAEQSPAPAALGRRARVSTGPETRVSINHSTYPRHVLPEGWRGHDHVATRKNEQPLRACHTQQGAGAGSRAAGQQGSRAAGPIRAVRNRPVAWRWGSGERRGWSSCQMVMEPSSSAGKGGVGRRLIRGMATWRHGGMATTRERGDNTGASRERGVP